MEIETAQKESILVVEDEALAAGVIKKRLESSGLKVHIERCGCSALSYATEHRPALVILDLRLPDMGGYEVCHQLRKLYHSSVLPVLMLTGMDRPIDQLRGFAHGADAYMTKPYDGGELLKTISLLLEESVPI